MYNEVIEARMKKLNDILEQLEKIRKNPLEKFKTDPILYSATERFLEIAIQCVLDIGNHIIAIQNWKIPKDYKDIISILGQNKVIPKNFAKKIEKMAGLRNILAHTYLEVNMDKIIENLKEIEDFRTYLKYILEFLEKKE